MPRRSLTQALHRHLRHYSTARSSRFAKSGMVGRGRRGQIRRAGRLCLLPEGHSLRASGLRLLPGSKAGAFIACSKGEGVTVPASAETRLNAGAASGQDTAPATASTLESLSQARPPPVLRRLPIVDPPLGLLLSELPGASVTLLPLRRPRRSTGRALQQCLASATSPARPRTTSSSTPPLR
jgi:hypothetical protein